MRTECLCISLLRVASGPRMKLASGKSALNPPVVWLQLIKLLIMLLLCDDFISIF